MHSFAGELKVEVEQLVLEVQPLVDNAPYRAVESEVKLAGLPHGEETAFAPVHSVLPRLEGGFVEGVVVLDDEVVASYAEAATLE